MLCRLPLVRSCSATPRLARGQATLNGLKSSSLRITRTTTPKPLVPNKELVFGRTFIDHMLSVEYDAQEGGWAAPHIHPHSKISLEPSAQVFHYGLEEFDTAELHRCIEQLCKLDAHWIPNERGYSLYLRPTLIATQASLGVGPSSRALLFVICSPVGPYYKTGFAAVSLLADPSAIRAWPGGVGDYKVGGNYAPGIQAQLKAASEGFQQNLWLFPRRNTDNTVDHMLTEVGTMNLFIYWKTPEGKRELVTPPLDGTILPGVTRDSILHLSRQWKEFEVSERPVSMRELAKASDEGRIIEMFGSGTAAIVSPIKMVRHVQERNADGVAVKFKDLAIPLDPKDSSSQAGPLTKRFSDTIMSIQYGDVEHPWSVLVK